MTSQNRLYKSGNWCTEQNCGLLSLKMANGCLNVLIMLKQKSLKIFKPVTLRYDNVLWPAVTLAFGKDVDTIWLPRTAEQCSFTLHKYLNNSFFYLFGNLFDLYQSLNRLLIWNSQNCSMFPLAFVAGWLQGHWWGFISRTYVVWPTFFLMNVFIALKGSHFWCLFKFMRKPKSTRF